MATSYPLPTLAPTVTSTGITAPAFEDIYNSLVASFQSIYGSDVYIAADSQDGQWLAVLATAQNDTNNAIIAVYNSFSPTYAVGAGLSAVVKINGITRESATYSTVPLTITGTPGKTIIAGIVQDENGYLWDLPLNTVIPDSTTITVTATCETAGAIVVGPTDTATTYTPTIGWNSSAFSGSAAPGQAAESDGALRQRQTISTSLSSVTPLMAIAGAVANVSGVSRSLVYQNDTDRTDANGVPSHSIAVVVEGGDVGTIAQTIEQTKAPGTGTYGTTQIQVLDPQGVPILINFFELDETPIYVNVTIQPLTGFVSSTVAAIQAAIAEFINSLAIGEDVYFPWIYGPAGLSGQSIGLTYKITALTIGLSPSSQGTSDIAIVFNAAATCLTTNVNVIT
jgi:uncharacterized phage protein gp47/JayE